MANEPQKWAGLLGSGADVNTIPEETPTGTGAASMKSIFPPITQVPLNVGGIAPDRADFNGLFKLLGDNVYYLQQGGVYSYDSTIDYAKGSLVKHNDNIYVAIQANGPATVEKEPGEDLAYWKIIPYDAVAIKDGTVIGDGSLGPSYRILGNMPNNFDETRNVDIFLAGTGNLRNINSDHGAGDLVAIGDGVMSEGHPSYFNIGIGTFALHSVNGSYNSSLKNGDRNVAIGSLSLFGLTTGRANVAMGRDSAQSVTTGTYNVAIGYGAIAGYATQNLDGAIATRHGLTGEGNTAVGARTGIALTGNATGNTVLGSFSAQHLKASQQVISIGHRNAFYVGYYTSYNGKKLIHSTLNGTYSQSGNTITITMPGHNAVTGCYVDLVFTSGRIYSEYVTYKDPQLLYVTSVSGNTFTVSSPISMTASGNCTASVFEQADLSTQQQSNAVCIGSYAAQNMGSMATSVVLGTYAARGGGPEDEAQSGSSAIDSSVVIGQSAAERSSSIGTSIIIGLNAVHDTTNAFWNAVVIGYNASKKATPTNSTVIGAGAASNTLTLAYSTILGLNAGQNSTKLDSSTYLGRNTGLSSNGESIYNTLIGGSAGGAFTQNFSQCSALGGVAMDTMQDGSQTATTITNSTAIGFQARVSGSNEVQLGNSSTTVYAYGAVQNRSDRRDKTDIRNTVLGSDFIMALRPVDFKWDMRDDYIETITDEEGNVKTIKHEKDGSKKRSRYHHGFIAQEVKEVMDAQKIDFGGYQDHSVNGGNDILTLGYEELIAPMIKTIQEQNALIQALEKRIKALEAKIK